MWRVWSMGRDSIRDIKHRWTVDDVVAAIAFRQVEMAESEAAETEGKRKAKIEAEENRRTAARGGSPRRVAGRGRRG